MNFKKFVRVIISMTYFENIQIILIYDISYKTLIDPKPLHIRFGKIDGFIFGFMMELDI